MRNYYLSLIITGLVMLTTGVHAQNSIHRVLKEIEENNKTLQAKEKLTDAQKLETQTGKYLENPTAEFEKMWGNRNNPESEYSFTFKQSLDFPSVYGQKNKLAELKSTSLDYQLAAYRQQLLLTAKQTCIEIIYLRKQKEVLDKRLRNAEQLATIYQRRVESGDANQLEINKIQLELLAARNQSRLNAAALSTAELQLYNLNGNIPIKFNDLEYPETDVILDLDTIYRAYLATDPNMKNLIGEQEVANQEVKVSRSLTLPKFDLGYKRNASGNNVSANGFVIGISIPLFENKNTVKRAKAQAAFVTTTIEESRLNLRSSLQQLYEQAVTLQTSRNEYAALLKHQRNVELLNKALQAGQLSIVDYFTELTTLYDSLQSFLDVERDYYNLLAQLFQYEL
ncbi:TolC family protein [Gabonibacter chumensis]|uniref:TolC family protein n=1 Tax=Gabonibacter chumensis TaxID=2972474 RepID=UPI00257387FD|nr:TolC family protein [Gabonibacter chumensis]MCR9010896.1 TolC family protein [Gabonibacter chumensis]